MKFCSKDEAVRYMNRSGLSGRPFIFIVDYKQEHVWVEEPDVVDPEELLYDLNGFTNVTGNGSSIQRSRSSGKPNLSLLKRIPGLFRQYPVISMPVILILST